MIVKKNPKFDLEKKRSYFIQIGLICSLLTVIIAFEWKTYDQSLSSLGSLDLLDLEEEIIPLTEKELKPPPPPRQPTPRPPPRLLSSFCMRLSKFVLTSLGSRPRLQASRARRARSARRGQKAGQENETSIPREKTS